MTTKRTPKHGDLRVWWIPQIPMKAFEVDVESLADARLLLDTLASYDQFQFDNHVKGDYANAGGLSAFDANDKHDSPQGSWVDWHDIDGEDFDSYSLADLRNLGATWEGDR